MQISYLNTSNSACECPILILTLNGRAIVYSWLLKKLNLGLLANLPDPVLVQMVSLGHLFVLNNLNGLLEQLLFFLDAFIGN